MKVKFKNLLMGYTGKADESVIYFSPKLGKYIIRTRPKPFTGTNQSSFAQVQKRIFALKPASAFIQDIKAYLPKYNALPANRERTILSWNYLYTKLMWNLHHIYKIDLRTLQRSQLASLPCHNLAAAIEAGLLPKVSGYQEYQGEI
jgi:hypothetical protein